MERLLTLFGNEKTKSRALIAFSAALLAVALVPLLALVPFNHPVCWDDYKALAELTKSPPRISYGQRFSTQFSNVLFYPPLEHFDFSTMERVLAVHRVFALVYIALFLASFFAMMAELNRRVLKAARPLFLAIFSSALFLLLNFVELSSTLFYCLPAATGYTGGLIFLFLFLALLLRHHFCAGGAEKAACDALLFAVTFVMSGFIEIFVLFAGFVALYLFLFAKNPRTKRRDAAYLLLFAFTLAIFASFFAASRGMIAAKYEQKAQTQQPPAQPRTAEKAGSPAADGEPGPGAVREEPAAPAKRPGAVASLIARNAAFLARIRPWCAYNVQFAKQEAKKLLSPHNVPLWALLLFLLGKTEAARARRGPRDILFVLFLYPVILLMSLSGCYSGLSWFTLYATVRNVFDIIFFLITGALLFALVSFARRFVSATVRISLIPSGADITKAAGLLVIAASVCLTSFASEKYLVGTAWRNVLSGAARRYDRTQTENYRKILGSDEPSLTLEYPGLPKALVNFQGNYILRDPTDGALYASKEVPAFFGKRDLFYSYEKRLPEMDLYSQEKRTK